MQELKLPSGAATLYALGCIYCLDYVWDMRCHAVAGCCCCRP